MVKIMNLMLQLSFWTNIYILGHSLLMSNLLLFLRFLH